MVTRFVCAMVAVQAMNSVPYFCSGWIVAGNCFINTQNCLSLTKSIFFELLEKFSVVGLELFLPTRCWSAPKKCSPTRSRFGVISTREGPNSSNIFVLMLEKLLLLALPFGHRSRQPLLWRSRSHGTCSRQISNCAEICTCIGNEILLVFGYFFFYLDFNNYNCS